MTRLQRVELSTIFVLAQKRKQTRHNGGDGALQSWTCACNGELVADLVLYRRVSWGVPHVLKLKRSNIGFVVQLTGPCSELAILSKHPMRSAGLAGARSCLPSGCNSGAKQVQKAHI
jgi:hypothetical protein